MERFILTLSDQLLIIGIAILIAGYLHLFNDRAIPVEDIEGNEDAWGFGQIVPVLLLSSIILTFIELYTEQKEKLGKQHSNSEGSDINGAKKLSGIARMSSEIVLDLTVDPAESEPAHVTPLRVDTEAGGR
ncbi:MAG: hypothetical protein Q9179_001786 [Wetmoreana sp. 5 TL-2023]